MEVSGTTGAEGGQRSRFHVIDARRVGNPVLLLGQLRRTLTAFCVDTSQTVTKQGNRRPLDDEQGRC